MLGVSSSNAIKTASIIFMHANLICVMKRREFMLDVCEREDHVSILRVDKYNHLRKLNNLEQSDVLANFYSTLLGYLLISPVHFNANFSRLVSSTSWSNMFQATMKTIQYYKPKRPKPLCIPLNGWNLSSLEIKSRCCNI